MALPALRQAYELCLPVALLHTEDESVITLPWGDGTNWVRNVLAAGECTIAWKGGDHAATQPRILGRDEARPYDDGFSWWMVEKAFEADSFLLLRRGESHSAAASLRDVRLCLAGSTHDDGGFRRAVLP